jgi:cell division protein FtsL
MHRVTRVLERLLILLFVLVVAAFAYLMLGNKGDTLKLNDEVMDKLSKLDALKS